MRMLAIADLHAEESVLDRLRVVATKGSYDQIFVVGDLTDRGPLSYAEELISILPDALMVHGNMDPPEVQKLMEKKGVSVHGKKVELGEWNVVGIGGSNPTPFKTPSEYHEDEIARILNMADVDKFSILLSHAPPHGLFDSIGDMHVGSTAVRQVIEQKKPLMCLCAHIHEHEGQEVLGDTLVVKLPPATNLRAAEIEIGDNIDVRFIKL